MEWNLGLWLINTAIVWAFCLLGNLLCYLKFRWGLVTKLNILITYVLAISLPSANYVLWNYDMQHVIIACSIMTVLILAPLVWYIKRFLLTPIQQLNHGLTRMVDGDLRQRVGIRSGDELGAMARKLDNVIDAFEGVVQSITQASRGNAELAEQLSSQSEEVNASMEQVASTTQEIAKSAQDLSKNAGQVQNNAKMTNESAAKGSGAAKMVDQSMQEIKTTTEEGAAKIRTLGERSSEIGQIVETINGISEQTNLLALNAAIEAARAGDAGRGFAVVADEVRKLAEESQKATTRIKELIGSLQEEIDASVSTMGENTTKVEEGAKAVSQALIAFEEIPVLLTKVYKSISEISAVAEENAAGSEEVSASVEEVSSAMQTVTNGAQRLTGIADQLRKAVSGFQVSQDSTSS